MHIKFNRMHKNVSKFIKNIVHLLYQEAVVYIIILEKT